ncbi:MAG: hypothetical protein ABEJ88_04115 [Halobacterium sp.]
MPDWSATQTLTFANATLVMYYAAYRAPGLVGWGIGAIATGMLAYGLFSETIREAYAELT